MARFAVGVSPSDFSYAAENRQQLLRLLLGLLVLFMPASFGLAQNVDPAGGILPFSTQIGGGIDSVDLASGNVLISIPIRNKVGKIPFSDNLVMNSHIYENTSGSSPTWGSAAHDAGLQGNAGYFSTYLTWLMIATAQKGCFNYVDFNVVDASGTMHPLGGDFYMSECYGGTPSPQQTNDGSGYTVTWTSSSPRSWTIYDSSGVSLAIGSVTDPDGTTMTASASNNTTTYTDTLGTTALTATINLGPTADTYTYTGANGNPQTYTVSYTKYNLQTNFGCPGISELSISGIYLPTSVSMPTGAMYSFLYEQTQGYGSSYTTGRIAKITLPSGGYISYGYSGGNNNTGINCISGVVPTLTRTVNDNNGNSGTWTYVNSNNSSTPGNFTVTETDPAGNQTIYSFSGEYQTQAVYSQGTSTVLKTVITCYGVNGAAPPARANCASPSTAPTLPITETDTYTSLGSSAYNEVQTKMDATYNNVTYSALYDWGVSLPTTQTYSYYGQSWGGSSCSAYSSGYVNNTPCYSVTENSSGTALAETKLTYNSDGKPASISRWTGASENTWLTTSFGYGANGAAAGVLSSVTDVNNAPTTHGSFACNGILPGSTTYPLGDSDSQTWDCNGGVKTSYTDVNGNTTSYSYADPLYRPTLITRPDGGTTSLGYNTGSSLPWWTESTTATIGGGSPGAVSYNYLDGLGRVYQNQSNDPNSSNCSSGLCWKTRSLTYNNLGQVVTVSNPYFTSSDETYGSQIYTYDALSRPLSDTWSSGASASWSYANAATEYTDFMGFAKVYQSDGLGRLVDICEVTNQQESDPGSPPGTCPVAISATGYLAQISYDVLNNVIGMIYGFAAQQRTFTYDGLSRLTSETHPESGTKTYVYDTQMAGDLYTRTAPLENQTGSATVVTTYTHDIQHRLTGMSYNDGLTLSVGLTYGQSSGWGNGLSNAKGRLSWLSTSLTGTDVVLGYDSMGRVNLYGQCTPAGCNAGSPVRPVATYNYNYIGEPSAGYAMNSSWSNTYNTIGQLTQIYSNNLTTSTTAGNLVSAITYNAFGEPTGDSLGNGIAETWHYTVPGFVKSLSTSNSAYSYTLSRTVGVVNLADDSYNGYETYSYDPVGRLSAMSNSSSGAAFTYSYDRMGNRWKQTVTAGTGPPFRQSFSTNNQISGGGYAYDAAGNMTNDTFHQYKFDAEGRVIVVDPQFSTPTASYVYNSRGLRASTTVGSTSYETIFDPDGNPSTSVVPGTETVNGPSYYYVAGRNWGDYQSPYTAPGATQWFLLDWLGSLRVLSNLNGTTTNYYTNFPFGEQAASSPNQQSLTFDGMKYDTEDNLFHTDARQLSPPQGRWLTPDPAGLGAVDPTNPQTWNRYAYVLNNPVSFRDPLGLDCTYLGSGGALTASGGCFNPTDNGYYFNGTVTSVLYNPDTQSYAVSYVPYPGSQGDLGEATIRPEPGDPPDNGPDTSTLLGLLGEAGCGPMGGCPQNPNPPPPCRAGGARMASCIGKDGGLPPSVLNPWWRKFLTTLVKRPNTGPGSCIALFGDTVGAPLKQLRSAAQTYTPLIVSALQAAPYGANGFAGYMRLVGNFSSTPVAETEADIAALNTVATGAAAVAPYVSAAAPYAITGGADLALAYGLGNELEAGFNGQCSW